MSTRGGDVWVVAGNAHRSALDTRKPARNKRPNAGTRVSGTRAALKIRARFQVERHLRQAGGCENAASRKSKKTRIR